MSRPILTVLVFLMFGAVAQAASFDCAKADTTVEHLICESPEISKLDEEMASRYKLALRDKAKSSVVKQEQKEWINRRNNCVDELCVKRAYLGRNMSLLNRPPTLEEEFELHRYEIRAFGKGQTICEEMQKEMNDKLRLSPQGPICVYDVLKTMAGVGFPEWKEIDLKANVDVYMRFARARGVNEADLHGAWMQAIERDNKLYLWPDIFLPPNEEDVALVELSKYHLAYPQEACVNFRTIRFSRDLQRSMPLRSVTEKVVSRWPFFAGSDKAIHVIINGQKFEIYETLSEAPQLSNGFSMYSSNNKIECSISGNF